MIFEILAVIAIFILFVLYTTYNIIYMFLVGFITEITRWFDEQN